MIKSSSIEPRLDVGPLRDEDAVEIRPRLIARGEQPARINYPSGRDAGALSVSPRAAARHFGGRRGGATVRSVRTSDLHRRKVIVTARKIATSQAGRRVLLRHVAYIERGATGYGARAEVFFDGATDRADSRSFVERCQSDRLHYRLVINPEDGIELGDLKSYARRVMAVVEEDLDGRLDWIAGAHFDTGRPHLHIMIRGRQADGRSLTIPGAYLSSGLRDRAQDVATEILGPRAERVPNRTIQADRLTPLDCTILRTVEDGRIDVERIPQAFRPDSCRRLIHLENMGRATPVSPGVWRLPHDLRQTLLQAGQLQAREIAATRILEHSPWRDQRSRLAPISLAPGERLAGAYVGVHRTGRYPQGAHAVVLDLPDGRLGHVLMRDARAVMCLDRVAEGAVIELTGFSRGDRSADHVIAEVAARQDGVWSAAHHALARPDDWPRFIAFHGKRAEAMSAAGACTALGDGRFAIPADYALRARQADIAQWGEIEPRLRVLDHRDLNDQVSAIGLTWLDRLMTRDRSPALQGPFGDAVRRALAERAKRLRMTGLGSGDPLLLSDSDIHRLTTFEVKSVFEALGQEGKAVFLTTSGQSAEGAYNGRIHIAGSPYAVIEGGSAINLVPWRPGMEACRGRNLVAVVQDGTASFRAVRGLGRELGLG